MWTLILIVMSCNTPFRLLASGKSPAPDEAHRHQYRNASGQATTWVGTHAHIPADRLPKDALGPQPPLGTGLPTRGPRTQSQTPVRRYKTRNHLALLPETLGSSYLLQWVGSSTRILWTLAPPIRQPAVASAPADQ